MYRAAAPNFLRASSLGHCRAFSDAVSLLLRWRTLDA